MENRSTRTPRLLDDALRIWQAGLAAVRSDQLVRQNLRVNGHWLLFGSDDGPLHELDLRSIDRIAVVGAGKAGAGMAAAVEDVLGPPLMNAKQLVGWINVPADCVTTLQRIHLHAARPAGCNEPTAEGVAGAAAILKITASLGPRDLCLALISGGGSALLPSPAAGISLADKFAITQFLSAAGANISQLNTVRKQLSRIKGGGLARACAAGKLVALIISDVIGDPLDVIASGPTVPDRSSPQQAIDVLEQFGAHEAGIAPRIFDFLSRKARVTSQASLEAFDPARVINLVIGNNALAVDSAGIEAERLGYSHAMSAATQLEGDSEPIGRHLAQMAVTMRDSPGTDCLISGGESVVRLADTAIRGLGGRNQQLVLAAMLELRQHNADDIVVLSAGTDGEDGPTDAAGAWCDATVLCAASQQALDAADYLRRNDAYHFFQRTGSLIKTGPTHTNVCDLRVVVVGKRQTPASR